MSYALKLNEKGVLFMPHGKIKQETLHVSVINYSDAAKETYILLK